MAVRPVGMAGLVRLREPKAKQVGRGVFPQVLGLDQVLGHVFDPVVVPRRVVKGVVVCTRKHGLSAVDALGECDGQTILNLLARSVVRTLHGVVDGLVQHAVPHLAEMLGGPVRRVELGHPGRQIAPVVGGGHEPSLLGPVGAVGLRSGHQDGRTVLVGQAEDLRGRAVAGLQPVAHRGAEEIARRAA